MRRMKSHWRRSHSSRIRLLFLITVEIYSHCALATWPKGWRVSQSAFLRKVFLPVERLQFCMQSEVRTAIRFFTSSNGKSNTFYTRLSLHRMMSWASLLIRERISIRASVSIEFSWGTAQVTFTWAPLTVSLCSWLAPNSIKAINCVPSNNSQLNARTMARCVNKCYSSFLFFFF